MTRQLKIIGWGYEGDEISAEEHAMLTARFTERFGGDFEIRTPPDEDAIELHAPRVGGADRGEPPVPQRERSRVALLQVVEESGTFRAGVAEDASPPPGGQDRPAVRPALPNTHLARQIAERLKDEGAEQKGGRTSCGQNDKGLAAHRYLTR